jgi:Carboxypeptidase regulatory-like domain/TonB dependent receptor
MPRLSRLEVTRRVAGVTARLLAFLLFTVPSFAQTRATTGDIVGVVRDLSGAVLPAATVTATHVETNLTRTAMTGPEGRFVLPALPLGSYTIAVELAGFARSVTENVVVALGSSNDLELTLSLETLTTRLTVRAEASPVDVRQTAVTTVVTQRQIDALPINGRKFISFSVITPGVAGDRTPGQGAAATSGLTFAGQRGRSNNVSVDGLDNNDTVVGSVRATFSQDAVREFQVLTNSFSAEFGKAAGGVVNIVTRSGANDLSGNAFFFFRDDALNRKDYFEQFNPAGEPIDRDKAPFGLKQFGATIGGPLRRDRSFYFVSYEQLDVNANNFVTIDDRNVVSLFGRDIGTPADILRRNGFTVETGQVPVALETRQFLAKLDHHFRGAQTAGVRFNSADVLDENIEPWGGLVAKSRGASLDSVDYVVAPSLLLVGRSSTINELRAQVAYRDQDVISLDPTCSGQCDSENEGGPTLEVSGVASVGRQRFTPQPRRNLRVQLVDTFTYYRGPHQLKTGIDYSYIDHQAQALPIHFGGRYIFAPLPAIPGLLPAPVSSIQALALGLPAAYIQGYGNASSVYGYQDLSLFAQDDWRIRSNLTAKLGVRYQNQFWPDVNFNVPGVGPYGFPSDNNNVAPRLALAWDPWNDGRFGVHGAYGLFYDNHISAIPGVTDIVDGTAGGVRTLVARFPASLQAWNAPGRRLPESAVGPFPSAVITVDPDMTTPYAHHATFGVNRQLPGQTALDVSLVYAHGSNLLGAIDYNPVLPDLGPNRRPEDRAGIADTSASILQYTSFAETWYRGLMVRLVKRLRDRSELLVSYTLSKAEDNATDLQTNFIPEDNGRGRDPNNPTGLPIGFDPGRERGPSLQDQRHRLVLSGVIQLPRQFQVSSIVTVASGRPYNILAGADLNGDGNGGTFPPDRARRNPADSSTSVARNLGTLPMQSVVDVRVSRRWRVGRVTTEGIVEVFNLFNRTNITERNNIFGTAAYPASPLPTFGQVDQVGPPLQMQLAIRTTF